MLGRPLADSLPGLRAAVLHELGGLPVVGDVEEPSGPAVGRVVVAGLNPIDLRVAAGGLGPRDVPYVLGTEAVVEHAGRRWYAAPGATLAERVAFDPEQAFEVPDGIDPALAVAYGVAGMAGWLALERGRLAPGESVLVLGASGIVGMVAVQAARAMGARRVVAAGRSRDALERALERGADAAVGLAAEELAAAGPFQLVVDPLWGPPAEAALLALDPGGRLVNLGESAGADASFPSAAVRWRQLEVLGHANAAHDVESRRRAYAAICAAGIQVDTETLRLDDVAEAWRRQAASPGVKLAIAP